MKSSKKKVNYRPSRGAIRRCGTCAYFYVHLGKGGCDLVKGAIDPSYTSDLYSPDFFPTKK